MALPDLGFSRLQEQVYRTLLANPTCGVPALAERFAVTEAELRACLDGLVDLAVVRPEPGTPSGVAVRDPSVALAQLVERVQDDLFERRRRTADTRAEFDALIAAHRRARGVPADALADTGIELITDVEQVRERLDSCRSSPAPASTRCSRLDGPAPAPRQPPGRWRSAACAVACRCGSSTTTRSSPTNAAAPSCGRP